MPRGDGPLGDIASVVLFENENVKVWNLIVDPGESSDWHLHTNEYLFIATSYGELKIEHDDGNTQETVMEVGKVVMGQKDSTHQLSNRGSSKYSSVIIEVKK